MMELNLLQTTELWVNQITLSGADLADMAAAVADTLHLERDKVLVVDVRPAHVAFDVLAVDMLQEDIIDKEAAILAALAELHGVTLADEASIRSNGTLGFICAGKQSTEKWWGGWPIFRPS